VTCVVGKPEVGDTVEVTYTGVVETMTTGGAIRINGGWHYPDRRESNLRITVVEKALQVGWHRVVSKTSDSGVHVASVIARHWNGHQWGNTESNHATVRDAYTSIEFLGGGDVL